MITSMMVLLMFGSDGDNDNIDDGVDEEYDTGVSECVNSTHAPDSFYCPSSVLSGQQIIFIITITIFIIIIIIITIIIIIIITIIIIVQATSFGATILSLCWRWSEW